MWSSGRAAGSFHPHPRHLSNIHRQFLKSGATVCLSFLAAKGNGHVTHFSVHRLKFATAQQCYYFWLQALKNVAPSLPTGGTVGHLNEGMKLSLSWQQGVRFQFLPSCCNLLQHSKTHSGQPTSWNNGESPLCNPQKVWPRSKNSKPPWGHFPSMPSCQWRE